MRWLLFVLKLEIPNNTFDLSFDLLAELHKFVYLRLIFLIMEMYVA